MFHSFRHGETILGV